MKIKVMLVDDHLAVRSGFARLLELEKDLNVIAEADSGEEAIELVKTNADIDVIIQDINLTGIDGIETTRQIKDVKPEIRIVALSIHETEPFISRCFSAGFDAYLSKRCAPEEIPTAIREVYKGNAYMSKDIAIAVAQGKKTIEKSPHVLLTEKEYQVFKLLAKGLVVKLVAKTLNISPKTVYVHREHIYRKLNVSTPFEIIEIARKTHSTYS